MAKCTILVGLPASGKSTWVAQNIIGLNARVLSTDSIIEQIAGDYQLTYNEGFPDLIKFADKVFKKSISDAGRKGLDIVIDRTNLTVNSRKRIMSRLTHYDYVEYAFDCIVFERPVDHEWERRLNSREGKTIPSDVLNQMVRSYQVPTYSEGFEDICFY